MKKTRPRKDRAGLTTFTFDELDRALRELEADAYELEHFGMEPPKRDLAELLREEQPGGRPEDSGFVTKSNTHQFLEHLLKKAKNLARANQQVPTLPEVAAAFGGKFGISGDETGARVIRRYLQRCEKTWSRDVRPIIETYLNKYLK